MSRDQDVVSRKHSLHFLRTPAPRPALTAQGPTRAPPAPLGTKAKRQSTDPMGTMCTSY